MRTWQLPIPIAVLLLGACADVSGPGATPVSLNPMTLPVGVTLSATTIPDSTGAPVVHLVFTNTGADTVQVVHGSCAFVARLYPHSSAEAAAWQSVPPGPRTCLDILYGHDLPPQGTAMVAVGRIAAGWDVPAPPAGTFLATAELVANGHYRVVPAGPVTVAP